MNYFIHILIMIGIYLILTQSLNLLMGFTGLLSLCQAAFYGIGAYTSTILMMTFGMNFFIAVFVSIIITVLLSFVVAIPSLKLKGDYFILATLGFQSIIFSILYNWVDFTSGPFGISGIPKPSVMGFVFDTPLKFLLLTTIFTIIILFFVFLITSTQFGRCLKIIREDELAAKVLGKNTISFKITAFAISAGIAAVAGALYASYTTYIDPTSFTITESLFLVTILAIGGSGNIRGPIIGTIVIVAFPEALRFLKIPDAIAPNIRMMLYALALILLMQFRQRGIAGEHGFE
ncbi:branched-chain amino acid ABC transporter permease [Thermodesulfobacteriota bacterium]